MTDDAPVTSSEHRLPGHVREHVGDLAGSVVVGTDGSAESRAAVRFAAQEAGARGCPLVVLRAWSLTSAPKPGGAPGVVPPMTDFEAAVSEEIRVEVAAELGQDPGVTVVPMPVHATAAQVLVEASRTAALVVVGHRGHGGFTGLLLGSVSDHLVRHAHGPVAIVREGRPPTANETNATM